MFIPFPFVHAQISVFYIICMIFAVPFLMDQYASDLWIGASLSFLTVVCLAGLHEVARELENPFRNVPNDLPLCTLQAQYNEALTNLFAGYHPDFYWDAEKMKQKLAKKKQTPELKKKSTQPPSSTADAAANIASLTTLKGAPAPKAVNEESFSASGETSLETSSEKTADSQISQLQVLIEEQGREIERLQQKVMARKQQRRQ